MQSLPLVGQPKPERADAERNRERVLAAAAQLHASYGVAGLKMDEVARLARVGKGTVYRRFENKAGLASALIDERVKEMHAGMLQGPPPLGPGASAEERLLAFVDAYIRHMARNIDLVLLAESATEGGRLGREVYPFWRQHVRILLTQTGAADAQLRAESIMAILAAQQLHHWNVVQGIEVDELIERVQAVVAGLLS